MTENVSQVDASQASTTASSQKTPRPKFHVPFKPTNKATSCGTHQQTAAKSRNRNSVGATSSVGKCTDENTTKCTNVKRTRNKKRSGSPSIPVQGSSKDRAGKNVRMAKTTHLSVVDQQHLMDNSQTTCSQLSMSETVSVITAPVQQTNVHQVYEFQLSPQACERMNAILGQRKRKRKKIQEMNKRKLLALIKQMQSEMADIRRRQRHVRQKIGVTVTDPNEE